MKKYRYSIVYYRIKSKLYNIRLAPCKGINERVLFREDNWPFVEDFELLVIKNEHYSFFHLNLISGLNISWFVVYCVNASAGRLPTLSMSLRSAMTPCASPCFARRIILSLRECSLWAAN